jgi:hypothetical protein
MSASDIAFSEIISDRMGWEQPEELAVSEPKKKKRKK